MTEYDPQTCITAGELRASGIQIPQDIPDCGWVPRWAVVPIPGSAVVTEKEKGCLLSVGFSLTTTVPFQWITMSCTVQ